MSIIPPVGLATAPTNPFPTPLKKPAAPSFWAPIKMNKQEKEQTNIQSKNHSFKYVLYLNISICTILKYSNTFAMFSG